MLIYFRLFITPIYFRLSISLIFFRFLLADVYLSDLFQAVYQADYVNNIRGTVTSMAEDNETKHVKAMGNIISPSAYRTKSEADGESHDGGRGHQCTLFC